MGVTARGGHPSLVLLRRPDQKQPIHPQACIQSQTTPLTQLWLCQLKGCFRDSQGGYPGWAGLVGEGCSGSWDATLAPRSF